MSISTTEFLNPQNVIAAIAMYNDIRTSLEETGWTAAKDTTTPGYWWTHPNHAGSFSMSAAHGQWRLDIEAAKAKLDAFNKGS
jgi:hypothetical protein